MLDFETVQSHADYPNIREEVELVSSDKKDLSFPKFVENKEEEERKEEERLKALQKIRIKRIREERRIERERREEESRIRIERDKRRRLENVYNEIYWQKNRRKITARHRKIYNDMEKDRKKEYESLPIFKYTELICKSMLKDDTVVKYRPDNYRDKRGHDAIIVTFTVDEHYYTATMTYNKNKQYHTDRLVLNVQDETHGTIEVFNEEINITEIDKITKFYKKKDRFLKRKRMAMAYKHIIEK